MSGTKKMLSIVLSVSVIALIPIAPIVYRLIYPSVEQQIIGEVVITTEWLEIHPDPPLKVSRNEQRIDIHVEDTFTPYTPNDGSWGETWGMRFSDGAIIIPEVQLVDENGNVYELESPSFVHKDARRGDASGGMAFRASLRPPTGLDLPQDRVYRTVRIRCDRSLRCSRIVWSCTDWK